MNRNRVFLPFTLAIIAAIHSPANACATYSAADIASAVANSPYASQAVKNASCTWGGAGKAESSGNTCAATASGGAFGVFQMTPSNLAAQGVTPSQYQNMSLQQQTNIWLQGAGPTQQGSSFNYINSNTGQAVSGTNLTQGMAAACSQFGSLICKNDLASIQSGGGCPTNIIKATNGSNGTLANGSANADGSGQTICSWGAAIQQKITQSGCVNANGAVPASPTTPKKINCPTPSGGAPGTAIPPTPASAPVSLPASLA